MHPPVKVARYVAIALGGIYAVAIALSGVHLDYVWQKILAYAPAGAVIVVVAFDLWLWKLRPINTLVDRPVLAGTWIATLRPHPDSHIPAGGNRGPIDAAVLIEQTYWTVAITLLTAESSSHSTAAAIRRAGDGKNQRVLVYMYDNLPQQQHRPRSQPHTGATQLAVVGRRPTRLTGSYWTDRLTVGDMELAYLDRRTDYTSLADVQGLQASP
jgi:hypothetical protein